MRIRLLQFKTLGDLRKFMELINKPDLEVNYNSLVLVCHCDDAEVELAINAFGAKVIE